MFRIFLTLIFLTAIVWADEDVSTAAGTPEEELKDMVVVGMQSIVSLNQLVTDLTTRLLQLTLTVSDMEDRVKDLKTSVKEEAAGLDNQIKDLSSKIDKLEKDGNVTANQLEILSGELAMKNSAVSVVSAEGDLRSDSCAKVCAGSTGRSSSAWRYYSSDGITITVDISACGFVTIPTITTAMEGATSHWRTTGSSEIYNSAASSFSIYIGGGGVSTSNAAAYKWNIEWIAVGYIC